MSENTYSIIAGVVTVVFLCAVILLSVRTWALGSDESDYKTICLGGHEYYRASFMQKGFTVIRLNDDGTPIGCIKR